ncbi:MAG: prepilin-type N-terminal cleavage/methylation domain-containing protein [Verrucomicrobiota bacterium]|nr:prepilin-type N-terminal cleavage/methylation domain-containing protein [Verrucomicrobiota bacterium]
MKTNPSFGRKRFTPGAFTLVEMLTVMAVIAILASLIIAVNGYVQRKAATARAEGEIAAMSAAAESYKADNGTYPRIAATDTLNPKTHFKASDAVYTNANLYFYKELSGDKVAGTTEGGEGTPDGKPETKPYFEFRRDMLRFSTDGKSVVVIQDPFGNAYGYSTAGAKAEEDFQNKLRTNPNETRPGSMPGFSSTFDLWSTAGGLTVLDQPKWIKNW